MPFWFPISKEKVKVNPPDMGNEKDQHNNSSSYKNKT